MGATPPRVFRQSFWNYKYLFNIVWMCVCGFRVILLLCFYQHFPLFSTYFFPGLISFKIDTLLAQLLQLSTDQFETMHTCSTLSEDVRVVLGLFSRYFFFNFYDLRFFFMWHDNVGSLWVQLLLQFYTKHFIRLILCNGIVLLSVWCKQFLCVP